jgi:hypothetical protein
MLALVILGVGVLAFIDAQQAFIRQNAWSSHAQTATYLANEVRERMRHVSRHDPVTGLFFEGAGASAVLRGWGVETGEVAIDDLDDVDDFSNLQFGWGGNMPGPIDAFGEVLPQLDERGNPVIVGGIPQPMRGWSQRVVVEKVDPVNFSAVLDNDFPRPQAGVTPLVPVDRFPLRVTVIVSYQGATDPRPEEVTRVQWVVP